MSAIAGLAFVLVSAVPLAALAYWPIKTAREIDEESICLIKPRTDGRS